MPKVSILMLTMNRIGITMRCLNSLEDTLLRADVETIVLDNGSADITPQWLPIFASHIPGMSVVLSTQNLGVAGGRAALMEMAEGEILVFLDSDVWATEYDWLDKLIAPLQDTSIGLAGPGGCWVTPRWEWYEPADADYIGRIDTVSGHCQAFPSRLLSHGVDIDTAFNPYWHEDTDFAMQVHALGLDVWCTGPIGLRHMYQASGDDGKGRAKQVYLASKWAGKGYVKFEQYEQAIVEARLKALGYLE